MEGFVTMGITHPAKAPDGELRLVEPAGLGVGDVEQVANMYGEVMGFRAFLSWLM